MEEHAVQRGFSLWFCVFQPMMIWQSHAFAKYTLVLQLHVCTDKAERDDFRNGGVNCWRRETSGFYGSQLTL